MYVNLEQNKRKFRTKQKGHTIAVFNDVIN